MDTGYYKQKKDCFTPHWNNSHGEVLCDVIDDAGMDLGEMLHCKLQQLQEKVAEFKSQRLNVLEYPSFSGEEERKFYSADTEARALHRLNENGRLVKHDSPAQLQGGADNSAMATVSVPESVAQIDPVILQSGIATFPGCCDQSGAPVVLIFTRHRVWDSEGFRVEELVKLLLYYYHVANDEKKAAGLTLIVDARGIKLSVLNSFLRVLYTTQASRLGTVNIVHVLVDRVAQSLIFRSPVFRPQANVKIDLVSEIQTLYKFIDHKFLPAELGGRLVHNHASWCRFRQKLEPILHSCQSASKYLVVLMNELTSQTNLPPDAATTRLQIDEHDHVVQTAFGDPRLTGLKDAAVKLVELLDDDSLLQQSAEYRNSASQAKSLFEQVQNTIHRVEILASKRMQKLEQVYAIRCFQQDAHQLIEWFKDDGRGILEKFSLLADNLKGIKQQKKEFEKNYFTSMACVEKASDVLEEASLLTQAEDNDEVVGVKDVSHELRARMELFNENIEGLREKIDQTAKCYQLLDKSYEWALDAMRYVAHMKMDNAATSDVLVGLKNSLQLYLQAHPPLTNERFEEMRSLAGTLDNEKLREQCRIAHERCKETDAMLKSRVETLQKAQLQLNEARNRRNSLRSNFDSVTSLSGAGALSHKDHCSVLDVAWNPKTTSTPSHPLGAFRRRSYAGKPCTPLFSPLNGAPSTENGYGLGSGRALNLSQYEQQLFSDGFITENMSERVVTCLPKGLSRNTRMITSRENLRDSRDSLTGSSENVRRPENESVMKTRSLPPSSASSSDLFKSRSLMSSTAAAATGSVHSVPTRTRPHRKYMRRAISLLDEAEQHQQEGCDSEADKQQERRGPKSFSMITGSTESLPSMPEEDEPSDMADTSDPSLEATPTRRPWSPCEVNSHFMNTAPRGGLQHHGSLADLRLTEEQVKTRRTLSLIMREILATEKDYVRALEFVIENYVPELGRDDVPNVLRGKRAVIFGNLEMIHSFHSLVFLKELESYERNPIHICHAFLLHHEQFYLYALYNKNKPKSDQLMSECGAAFFRRKQRELGDRMDLASYLLKPVQRMGKYALLLNQLLKEAAENEKQDLVAALDMVKFQLRHGNDLLAMDSIRECDINLQEQGQLLRQEEFLIWAGRKKSLRRVFLFEQALIFTKARRASNGHDVYVYKHSMKTADIGLTESIGDYGYKFGVWFRKRTSTESYTLQSSSAEAKNAWVHELSRLLWRQAIRNKENRMQDMANMGIGNKPCLDLKASKNNINDRFVNISLKGRRLSASALDQLKNGAKRPHSIISVSSTSSSNSSGGVPTQVLPFLPETPDAETRSGLPKSFTMCSTASNESGIVADVSSSSASTTEDACTQTTLKRGSCARDLAGGNMAAMTGFDRPEI